MNRFWNLVLGLAALFPPSLLGMASALADQTDPRLPALFDRLQRSRSSMEAQLAELLIWRIWGESGDVRIDTLIGEGSAALQANDFKTARKRFDAVIQERPNFAEAWNKRATLFYLAGEYKKSLDDIQRVLELEPRHFGALSGLGLVNIALSRDLAALDAFERVLVLYPANKAAKSNLLEIEKRLRENEI
jgi:tetratricopeptide (TPR) repeat protein